MPAGDVTRRHEGPTQFGDMSRIGSAERQINALWDMSENPRMNIQTFNAIAKLFEKVAKLERQVEELTDAQR